VTVTYRQCRAAAASVRRAEHGRSAVARLRGERLAFMPPRPRLAVLLYIADAQDRLVWHSPTSLVLLSPPRASREPAGAGRRARRLRLLESCWPYLRDFGPAVLVLAAMPLLLLAGQYARLSITVVGLSVIAYLLVLVCLATGRDMWSRLRALKGRSRVRRVAADPLLNHNWSIGLCHADDPAGVESLIRDAQDRTAFLADGTGYENGNLLCSDHCVTTTAALESLVAVTGSARLDDVNEPMTVVRRPGDRRQPTRPPERGAPFLRMLSGCMLVLLAVQALMIVKGEREACGATTCDGPLTTYPGALLWLLERAIPFGGAGAGVPRFWVTQVLGLIAPVLGLTFIAVLGVTLSRQARSHRASVVAAEQALARSLAGAADAEFGGVFISYRSGPHRGAVNAIRRELAARFGQEKVFIDHRSISVGQRYPDELRAGLARSAVLVAVIHDRWLEDLRVADDPTKDWVRYEIGTALANGVTVIAAYLDSVARLAPGDSRLPEDIAELVFRQSLRIRYGSDDLDDDLDRLIEAVAQAAVHGEPTGG